MAVFPIAMMAYVVKVDGIYNNPNKNAKTTSLTNKSDIDFNKHSESVVIPSSIVSKDITYNVTSLGGNRNNTLYEPYSALEARQNAYGGDAFKVVVEEEQTPNCVVVPIWEIWNNTPYTQDGVTVAYDYPNLSITSLNKSIVMVGIKREYVDNMCSHGDSEASNTFGFDSNKLNGTLDNDNINSSLNISSTNPGNLEKWTYSIKDLEGISEYPVIGYDVWKGSTSQLIFSITDLYDANEIVVYLEGASLPEKSLFAMQESKYKEPFNGHDSYSDFITTIFYGYNTFLPEEFEMGEVGFADYSYVKAYKYLFNTDGTSNRMIGAYLIKFDESCSEYKPKSTSKWFKDVYFDKISFNNLDLSEVTDMSFMFENCQKYDEDSYNEIEQFNLSDFSFSNHPKVTGMFSGAKIKNLYVSYNVEEANDDIFENLGYYSNGCYLFGPEDLLNSLNSDGAYVYWKGGKFKLKEKEGFASLSEDGKTLTFTYGIKPMNMGDNVYDFNTVSNNPAWYGQRANITKVVFAPSFVNFKPTSTNNWFSGMSNLEEIVGLEYLNTSETTAMSYMFYGCSKLKSIDVSHFETVNVEKMGYMFQNCSSLESIDISGFDYSNNTSCYRMFNGCSSLKEVKMGAWKNNSNNQYGYMFSGCSALESLDLSLLNLPSDAKTTNMLYGCSALRELAISPSMSVLNSTACSGVGTANSPCDIIAPDDFDFGVDTSAEPFRWKSGYFRLATKLLAETSNVKKGNVYDLRILLQNGSHIYNGYQFNVRLPEGFELTQDAQEDYVYTLSNRYAVTPSVRITPQDDGSYQVLSYAMDNAVFKGKEGVIITLSLSMAADQTIGTYSGTITDIALNNPDNTPTYLQDAAFDIVVPVFATGDVNHDRSVNITDVMMTVNHVVGKTPLGFCEEDADINGDNVINISDIMSIVNILISEPTSNAPANIRESMTDAIMLTPTTQGYAVALQNKKSYTALQMDVQMPDDAPLQVRLMDKRSDGHSVICSDLGDGRYRIVVYSLNGHALKESDGILLQLTTGGKHDVVPAILDVQLTNHLFETVSLSDISCPTGIGDVMSDENLDVPAYNVQGMQVPRHHRGIVIQNGRKQVQRK